MGLSLTVAGGRVDECAGNGFCLLYTTPSLIGVRQCVLELTVRNPGKCRNRWPASKARRCRGSLAADAQAHEGRARRQVASTVGRHSPACASQWRSSALDVPRTRVVVPPAPSWSTKWIKPVECEGHPGEEEPQHAFARPTHRQTVSTQIRCRSKHAVCLRPRASHSHHNAIQPGTRRTAHAVAQRSTLLTRCSRATFALLEFTTLRVFNF